MAMRPIARKEDLTICFAHVAYRMAERFAARGTGIKHFQVGSLDELVVENVCLLRLAILLAGQSDIHG